MTLKGCHIFIDFPLCQETFLHKPAAQIADEIAQDGPSVVAGRIDMDDRDDADIFHARLAEHSVRAAADKEIDPVRHRIGLVGLKQAVPCRQRRIACMGKVIGLEAGHPTAGPHERHHLAYDAFGLGNIYQDEAHVSAVECATWQPGVVGIPFSDFDLRQSATGDEASCLLDEMRAAVDAENGAGRADALCKEMQDPSRPASEINHLFTGRDSNEIELRRRIRSEIVNLSLQPLFLGLSPSE